MGAHDGGDGLYDGGEVSHFDGGKGPHDGGESDGGMPMGGEGVQEISEVVL